MDAVHQEWLNENAFRAYPLAEDTNLVSTDPARLSFPPFVLVDCVFSIAGAADVSMALTSVAVIGQFLTLEFSDGVGVIVATLSVNTDTHTENQGYTLTGQGIYDDARGRVVLGDLSNLREALPDGAYTYEAQLEPAVVRPDIRGVRSLQTGEDATLSPRITGHVKLLEGSNIAFTYLPAENMIRVDAIDKSGFDEECECEDNYEPPSCIRRINGINADDVTFIGDGKCIDVRVSGSAITFANPCSEPCCGCTELEFITQHLELLQTTLGTLEDLATRLESRYQEFIDRILTSTKGGG